VFSSSHRPSGNVKDDCWLCSAPVYEGDAAVTYLGLWIHQSCFLEENTPTDSDTTAGDDSPATGAE